MKLVEDPMFCHSTLDYEPDSKPFQHNDNTLVDTGPKEGKEILKEEQHVNLFGLKGCEKETDPLPFELNDGDRIWRTPDIHCFVSMDSLRNGNKSEVRDSVAPYTISSSKTELLEDTDFFTDKSVTECELPELIVCYKESYNPVVKDICVDEGVPSTEKISVENGKEEPVDFCCSFSSSEDIDCDSRNEKVDIGLPVLDEVKALEENSCNNHIFKHSDIEDTENSEFTKERVNIELRVLGELKSCEVKACNNDTLNQPDSVDAENIDLTKEIEYNELPIPDELKSSAESACKDESDTEDLIQSGETRNDAKDEIESDVSEEKVLPENRLLKQDSGMDNYFCIFSEVDGNEVGHQSFQMPSGDTISVEPTPDSAADESNNSSFVDELIYNSKVENGSITFHFDSSSPSASGRTEGPQNVDCEPPLDTPNSFRHEDDTPDHLKVLSQVQRDHGESSFAPYSGSFGHEDDTPDHLKVLSQVQRDHGESSFAPYSGSFGHEDDTRDHLKVLSQVQRDHGESSFAPYSGSITYSGPIAYTGSLSLRSDSSTTSTRSFAFPILQGEWNYSPERMAKAERRRFRKHRGWMQGILCCRF